MSDWAFEVELSEKAVSASIRKIIDDLKNNEDISIAITEIAEYYNIPEDIEGVIKNWLFDKYEQDRIASAQLYRTRKTDL
jgi:hypothetical protein